MYGMDENLLLQWWQIEYAASVGILYENHDAPKLPALLEYITKSRSPRTPSCGTFLGALVIPSEWICYQLKLKQLPFCKGLLSSKVIFVKY